MTQTPNGALRGIRVLDLSRVLGGPFCTQFLGDHGADIIKVEPPSGDETRAWGPPFSDSSSAYFDGVNRNKRSIALDLDSAEGQRILHGFLADADVLVQNFKLRSLERWNLLPESLQQRHPRLVQCWITGFGADGPLGGLPGYDAVAQALTGLMSVNGEAGGPPLRIGAPVVDLVTGLNAALGIMLALRERDRTGRGQIVEASLFDTGISLMHPHVPNYLGSGISPQPTGSAHPNITPYDRFATADGGIFLAVGNNGQFAALCRCLGVEDLAHDPRFSDNGQRNRNRDKLKNLLERQLSERQAKPLAEELMQAGVPCAPILDVAAAVAHPHTAHRGMIVDIGSYRGIGSPLKMSHSQPSYRLPPPRLDEHREELLASMEPAARVQE